jgi:DNA-3-methyladenine glycosylase
MILPKPFYLKDSITVAKELLGKTLIKTTKDNILSGIIVETEAYLQEEESCHAYKGITPRTKTMFEEGGLLYVYFIYGMYHCINVVTEEKGRGCAVLIRGIEPVSGIETMENNRKTNKKENLTNGPGKLAQAFGFTKKENGIDLTLSRSIYIEDQKKPVDDIVITKRIGINKAKDLPYRFYLKNNDYISRS